MSTAEWVAPQWQERLAAAGLNSPRDLLHKSPDELGLAGCWEALTKPGLGGRQRWRWTLENGDETSTLYVKRYAGARWKEQLDRIIRQTTRHSRGWWEYSITRRLGESYVPVPVVVAAAESMASIFERRSVILLESVPGDGFDRIWSKLRGADAAITTGLARHDFTTRLGRLLSALHQTGVCHRDLYLCHVFADVDQQARRAPVFNFIDLARAFVPRLRRTRWIVKDLSQADASARQIGASRADRLRFLRAYLGLQRRAPRVRWYARRIVRKSDWILRRIERKRNAL